MQFCEPVNFYMQPKKIKSSISRLMDAVIKELLSLKIINKHRFQLSKLKFLQRDSHSLKDLINIFHLP